MKRNFAAVLAVVTFASVFAHAGSMDLPISGNAASAPQAAAKASVGDYKRVSSEEGAMIKKALIDAGSASSAQSLKCKSFDLKTKETSDTSYDFMASIKIIAADGSTVYRRADGQPVLKFVTAPTESSNSFEVLVTTDDQGQGIGQIQYFFDEVTPASVRNVGTIANPDYEKVAERRELARIDTCKPSATAP